MLVRQLSLSSGLSRTKNLRRHRAGSGLVDQVNARRQQEAVAVQTRTLGSSNWRRGYNHPDEYRWPSKKPILLGHGGLE